MSEKQISEAQSPAASQQKEGQDKNKVLNKKLEMIFQQVKTLYALQYTKTDKYPNQIIPHLYLGSVGAALSKDVLLELNIKYVLTAMDEMKHPFPDIISEYKIIRVKDSKTESLLNYFVESNEFIQKAISNNENILVHCFAGVSRSAAFILAYLIKYQNQTLSDALQLVQSARPVVKPNQNFLNQLKKYEEETQIEKNSNQQYNAENENKNEVVQDTQPQDQANIQSEDKPEITDSKDTEIKEIEENNKEKEEDKVN